MSDQHLLDPMDEHLRGIAASFPYPPAPDIAGAVRQRLARVNTSQPATVRPRRRLAWGLAALTVLLFLAALLTVPEVQAFVRSLFRIGAIEVVVATPVPTSGLITPEPSPVPSNPLDLVGETTLALANEELPFTIKLPTYPGDLGRPDRVFMQDLSGPALILAWTVPGNHDQARLVLYTLGPGVYGEKTLRDSTIIQETSVKGERALWIHGSHWLRFYGEGGRPEFAPRRLVSGNCSCGRGMG